MSGTQPNLFEKLLILSGETTIDLNLLAEDLGLITLIKSGVGQEACLEYLNENY
jgi:hypothetical protein